MARKLLIIVGPTAVGKTDWSIEAALRCGSPVISCDSRQIYREMSIGTAVPDAAALQAVRHYFIQTRSVTEPYSAGEYAADALALIEDLFAQGHETLVMAGGSGFYVDAVCAGAASGPPSDAAVRAELMRRLAEEGLEPLREELRRRDPVAAGEMDLDNPRRVVRALEVCLATGRPFSFFRQAAPPPRVFTIEKIGLTRPRAVLYERIDRRVTDMMEAGLLDEVRSLLPYRDLPALQTVGYRELFAWLDVEAGRAAPGDGYPSSLEEAADLIRRHTRNYAKRQLTWWRRDPSIRWTEL